MPAMPVSALLSATGRGAGWLVGAPLNPVAGMDKEGVSKAHNRPTQAWERTWTGGARGDLVWCSARRSPTRGREGVYASRTSLFSDEGLQSSQDSSTLTKKLRVFVT